MARQQRVHSLCVQLESHQVSVSRLGIWESVCVYYMGACYVFYACFFRKRQEVVNKECVIELIMWRGGLK